MTETAWLWPVLLSSAITGVSVGIGFAFAMSRQIADLRGEIGKLATRFDGWDVRCTLTHEPIKEKLADHTGRLNDQGGRLRTVEERYGIKAAE